jgi:hypothetical protein
MKMELDDTVSPGQAEIIPAEPSRGIMERPYTGKEIIAQVLKPGAEKLNLTFRISPKIIVEDLGSADEIRYRVLCKGYHILSGDFLGDGIGEASSNEEKYKWRRAVVNKEFDETPEDRRREVYKKNKQGAYVKVKQVRTNPADIANTVLKMAKKRGNIDMILTVTAASDKRTRGSRNRSARARRKRRRRPPQRKRPSPRRKQLRPRRKPRKSHHHRTSRPGSRTTRIPGPGRLTHRR